MAVKGTLQWQTVTTPVASGGIPLLCSVLCPKSGEQWNMNNAGEKVAGHFTSVSFDTLSQWYLKAINAILELLALMWEKKAGKGMQLNSQKHWLLFSWLCLKGGDETAAFAVSQACTRTQMNQSWRHVQFFSVFRATAYALTPEALIIAHREHINVSKELLFFLCFFTCVHWWFP